ncbi:hypothetical protein CTI14_72300, partial [Methylobacterium radiotolerans]
IAGAHDLERLEQHGGATSLPSSTDSAKPVRGDVRDIAGAHDLERLEQHGGATSLPSSTDSAKPVRGD